MIIGAHSIISSLRADKDRKFFKDILGMPHADDGDGWLIFGLPPSEVAVHPANENDVHSFYLMCRDIQEFVAHVRKHKIRCSPVQEMEWGLMTHVTLPGGGTLGVYEPLHVRPKSMPAGKRKVKRKSSARRTPARGAKRAPKRK